MWDGLAAAAWIDPTLITKRKLATWPWILYHGAGYGNTLTWAENDKLRIGTSPVEIQLDLDNEKFDWILVGLMTAPTRKNTSKGQLRKVSRILRQQYDGLCDL